MEQYDILMFILDIRPQPRVFSKAVIDNVLLLTSTSCIPCKFYDAPCILGVSNSLIYSI